MQYFIKFCTRGQIVLITYYIIGIYKSCKIIYRLHNISELVLVSFLLFLIVSNVIEQCHKKIILIS